MNRAKILLATALLPLAVAAAEPTKNPALIDVETGVSNPAPEALEYDSYMKWAEPLLRADGRDAVSAFTPKVFEWFQREKDRPLPPEVARDPEHIYANVKGPLEETINLEKSGETEEGNTVGAEVYAELSGTVKESLETMLFRWGKPVNAGAGKTYPAGGNFGRRVDYYAPNSDWGPNAFASLSMRRNGGIVHDLYDRYLLLVRGDDQRGYDVLMQFLKPGGATETKQVFAMVIIRPISDKKTSYKINTRFQGQSYKASMLGLKGGRDQIGFNEKKVRAVLVESNAMLKELQTTGTIKDKKTDIEFGK